MLKKTLTLFTVSAIVATLGTAKAQWTPYGQTMPQFQGPTTVTPNNPWNPNSGYTIRGPEGMTTVTPNNPWNPNAGWTARGPNGMQSITPNNPWNPNSGWTIR